MFGWQKKSARRGGGKKTKEQLEFGRRIRSDVGPPPILGKFLRYLEVKGSAYSDLFTAPPNENELQHIRRKIQYDEDSISVSTGVR